MQAIIIILFVTNTLAWNVISSESNEGRYVDLLTDDDKKEFLDVIERRMLNRDENNNGERSIDRKLEVSDEDKHNDYVKEMFEHTIDMRKNEKSDEKISKNANKDKNEVNKSFNREEEDNDKENSNEKGKTKDRGEHSERDRSIENVEIAKGSASNEATGSLNKERSEDMENTEIAKEKTNNEEKVTLNKEKGENSELDRNIQNTEIVKESIEKGIDDERDRLNKKDVDNSVHNGVKRKNRSADGDKIPVMTVYDDSEISVIPKSVEKSDTQAKGLVPKSVENVDILNFNKTRRSENLSEENLKNKQVREYDKTSAENPTFRVKSDEYDGHPEDTKTNLGKETEKDPNFGKEEIENNKHYKNSEITNIMNLNKNIEKVDGEVNNTSKSNLFTKDKTVDILDKTIESETVQLDATDSNEDKSVVTERLDSFDSKLDSVNQEKFEQNDKDSLAKEESVKTLKNINNSFEFLENKKDPNVTHENIDKILNENILQDNLTDKIRIRDDIVKREIAVDLENNKESKQEEESHNDANKENNEKSKQENEDKNAENEELKPATVKPIIRLFTSVPLKKPERLESNDNSQENLELTNVSVIEKPLSSEITESKIPKEEDSQYNNKNNDVDSTTSKDLLTQQPLHVKLNNTWKIEFNDNNNDATTLKDTEDIKKPLNEDNKLTQVVHKIQSNNNSDTEIIGKVAVNNNSTDTLKLFIDLNDKENNNNSSEDIEVTTMKTMPLTTVKIDLADGNKQFKYVKETKEETFNQTDKNGVAFANKIINALRQRVDVVESDNGKNSYKYKKESETTVKVYEVYETDPNQPFVKKNVEKTEEKDQEEKYYVPVYNYSPNNAYYNPYNKYGPNDGSEEDNSKTNKIKYIDMYESDGLDKKKLKVKKVKSKPEMLLIGTKFTGGGNVFEEPIQKWWKAAHKHRSRIHKNKRNRFNKKQSKYVTSDRDDHYNILKQNLKDRMRAIRNILFNTKYYGKPFKTDDDIRGSRSTSKDKPAEYNPEISMDYYYNIQRTPDDFYDPNEANQRALAEVLSPRIADLRKKKEKTVKGGVTVKQLSSFVDPSLILANMQRFLDVGVPLSRKQDSHGLQTYVKVIGDLLEANNEALVNYDWLDTTVKIQAGLAKLFYLIESVKHDDEMHPSDLELLRYVMFLHQYALYDEVLQCTELDTHRRLGDQCNYRTNSTKIKRYLLQENWKDLKLRLAKSKGLFNRVWLFKGTDDYDDFVALEKFLNELQSCLYSVHSALTSISEITNYNTQNWFRNLKELYLKDMTERQLLEVILHLSTVRLLDLIEHSSSRGLEDNYIQYIDKNLDTVLKSKEDFLFVMKIITKILSIKVINKL